MTGPTTSTQERGIVVVGFGMVAHRFLSQAIRRGLHERLPLTVIGEEGPYDRVRLSSWFDTFDGSHLALPTAEFHAAGVRQVLGSAAVHIDRTERRVELRSGWSLPYDRLVLATGSTPFVPPVSGRELPGCFVYRTIEDVAAIHHWITSRGVWSGVVVGGGLLGLEAANALLHAGVETHVVEMAPHLMPQQLDAAGGHMLGQMLADQGIRLRLGTTVGAIRGRGAVEEVACADGASIPAQVVVFSAGIRPRDELAASAGLTLAERGGVVVDRFLRTSDRNIDAIGECAAVEGRCYGLVGPGYQMADLLAARLAGEEVDPFGEPDLSTRLKVVGCEVASFGAREGGDELVVVNSRTRRYHKLVLDSDTGAVRGGVLVGDTAAFSTLVAMSTGALDTPEHPETLLVSGSHGEIPGQADELQVCSCASVTTGMIRHALLEGATTVDAVAATTGATTGCGGCAPSVKELVRAHLASTGAPVNEALCLHFPMSRHELFASIRSEGITTFAEALERFGRAPEGCEVCKPAVASMLASMSLGHILDGDQARLQDTNDWALANLQRNGTYSVVPRVPGGEITPDQLIALGQIAKDFGLYAKITGGQRVDLLGAQLHELPDIWRRVIDAGMESGHAYGKAVRTVKSCVGDTWCRYGVQDSTTLAIDLELRYRGLRAPHKIKMAVSGCARECAEAQSKDVGVIATEAGWNLYLGGNGGQRPRHAELFLTDVDRETLIRTIDRFLIYYIWSADRLERTATWLAKLDGGLERLRAVIVHDEDGICADLDAAMANHVASYRCEWTEVLENPDRLARFRTFVNDPTGADPTVRFGTLRGQPVPLPSPLVKR